MTHSRTHLVRAPSNIALIKYMGKRDALANLPENPSLSMTLESLATWAAIEVSDALPSEADSGSGDPQRRAYRSEGGDLITLLPGVPDGSPSEARAPQLSEAGIVKVLRHTERARLEAARILPAHGLVFAEGPRALSLRTGNTFPEASGIASSASSFAAVTLAVTLASAADPDAFRRTWRAPASIGLRRALARVSRRGSGSSCRSFEGPWVEWRDEGVEVIIAPAMPALVHFVLLISSDAKSVSSSEAHLRVKGSPLWAGRPARVIERITHLRTALADADLGQLAQIAWREAWEMHSLFHTAAEPFTYWKPGTVAALEWLAPFVANGESSVTAPIVTLDAGPNVHITVRAADAGGWRERFRGRFEFLEDRPGTGAEIFS